MTNHTIPTDKLERLAKAITPGPWRVGPVDDTRVEDADGNEVAQIDGDYNQPETWPLMEANAEAVALVPTLLRELIARRKADEWQTISTAPKDGTRVLAYYEADDGVYDVCWDDALGWVSHDYEITNFMQSDFTAWRPLPSPPSTLTAGDSHDD